MVSRILVVDDEPNHQRVLAIGLRLEGFEVSTARDAVAALAVLRQVEIGLAIIDLMMPGTNGIQLARRIRDEFPSVRVVLTSAYHLSEPQLVRADCGAIAFVPKPYDLDELVAFLRAKLAPSSVHPVATPDPETARVVSG